jgi:hypothetical protein
MLRALLVVLAAFDAIQPLRLARFWSGILDWQMADDPHDGVALLPSDDTGFRIRFVPTQEQKVGPNRMHFDLTSTSLEDQQQTVPGRSDLVHGGEKLRCMITWSMPTDNGIDIHGEPAGYGGWSGNSERSRS